MRAEELAHRVQSQSDILMDASNRRPYKSRGMPQTGQDQHLDTGSSVNRTCPDGQLTMNCIDRPGESGHPDGGQVSFSAVDL